MNRASDTSPESSPGKPSSSVWKRTSTGTSAMRSLRDSSWARTWVPLRPVPPMNVTGATSSPRGTSTSPRTGDGASSGVPWCLPGISASPLGSRVVVDVAARAGERCAAPGSPARRRRDGAEPGAALGAEQAARGRRGRPPRPRPRPCRRSASNVPTGQKAPRPAPSRYMPSRLGGTSPTALAVDADGERRLRLVLERERVLARVAGARRCS